MKLKLYTLIILSFLIQKTYATTIESVIDGGLWTDPNSWSTNTVPDINDDVVIKAGHQIYANKIDQTISSPTYYYQVHNGKLTLETGSELYCLGNGFQFTGEEIVNNGCIVGTLVFKSASLITTVQKFSGEGIGKMNMFIHNIVLVQGSQNCGDLYIVNDRLIVRSNSTFAVLGTITGITATNYIQMSTLTSRLQMPVSNTSKLFPIGNAVNYTPVLINNSGINTYAVGVQSIFQYPLLTNGKVNREWYVDRITGAANPYDLRLSWNPKDEDVYFNSGACAVAKWNIADTYWQAEQTNAEASSTVVDGLRTRTLSETTAIGNFTVVSGASLPVELASFKGVEFGLNNVLRWTTLSEENAARHTLERWIKDENRWIAIGNVKAHGTTSEAHNYTLEDKNPLSESYYRLKLEDKDGRFQYSKTIVLKRKSDIEGSIAPYPNPFHDEISVGYKIPKLADKADLLVIDQFGKVVTQYSILPNNDLINLNMGFLQEGEYYLQFVSDNGAVITKKIIKQ